MDERLWLLSTAYNTGVECLQCVVPSFRVRLTLSQGLCSASLADEAKRWFECSTVLCRFVPDGRLRAEKVCSTTTTRHAHNAALPRLSPDIQSLQRTTDALHRSTNSFSRLTTFVFLFPVSLAACHSRLLYFFLLQCNTCVIIAPQSL